MAPARRDQPAPVATACSGWSIVKTMCGRDSRPEPHLKGNPMGFLCVGLARVCLTLSPRRCRSPRQRACGDSLWPLRAGSSAKSHLPNAVVAERP